MVELVNEARVKNIPIITTRWIRTRGSNNDIFDEIGHWSQFVPTPNEDPLRELSGVEWDLWLNTVYTDAFAPVYDQGVRRENVLRTYLEENNIQNLLIAGTWAEACVSMTAYTAAVLGFTPVIAEPAVGGYIRSTLKNVDMSRAHVVKNVNIA